MKSLYKIKLALIIVCVFAIAGCVKEDESIDFVSNKDIVIDINTTRAVGNILRANSGVKLRASTSDPFTEIREVECFESVVLPELQPHIWIGNILTKSSVADCNYNPLIYPRNPITVSSTLPGMNPLVIENPSFSKYMSYIQEQTAKGNFSQKWRV